MHLAQLNIAKPKYANDDPRFADFMDNLDRVNGLAAKMPGFIWHNQDELGHSMEIPTPWPDHVSNLTVWERAEDLQHFVWNTVHKKFYNRKNEWFEKTPMPHFVMWWVEEGHRPTLEEAKERLDFLNINGNTDYAFDWSYLPDITLWQTQQCG